MNRTTLFIIFSTCMIAGTHSLTCSESAAHFQNTVCDSEEPAFTTNEEVFYKVTVDGHMNRLITGGLTSSPDEMDEAQQFQQRSNDGILQVYNRIVLDNYKVIYMFSNLATNSLSNYISNNPFIYNEQSEELFKFMANLLEILTTIRSKNWVLRNLEIGNILLTDGGSPLIYDLSGAVNILNEYYVPEHSGALSYDENIDFINKDEHSAQSVDDFYKAGLVMFNLMYAMNPYIVSQYASLESFRNTSLYFSSSSNLRAVDICSQLLYSFDDKFDFLSFTQSVIDSASESHIMKTTEPLSYDLKDGPVEAMAALKQSMGQTRLNNQGNRMFNDQNSSTQEYISQDIKHSPILEREETRYMPSNLEQRMYYENNYLTQKDDSREEQDVQYRMPEMDFDYKMGNGSILNKSLTLDREGMPTGLVIVLVFCVFTFLFNIAAIIFMMMSCRKDYFGFLVDRNNNIELSRV